MSSKRPRLPSPWIAMAAICVAGWIAAGCMREKPPNLLLITLDTVRADHVGCYGRERGLTPTLDALAARGVRFARCVAPAPITLPSHATMLTGLYPVRHGVRDNSVYALSPETTTLAEALHDAGFHTGASVASIALGSRFGLDQGFDTYDEGRLIRSDADVKKGGLIERDGREIAQEAIRFLDEAKEIKKPFFFWAHFYDPHEPYNFHPETDAGGTENPYESEIRYVDAQVKKILDRLAEDGLESRTVVIVAADHGEGLGQHNERTHLVLAYESTLSVPLILAGPGIAEGRTVTHCLGRLVDVTPTLLDLAGARIPGKPLDGQSLLPLCAPTTSCPPGPEIAYFETRGPVSFDWCPLDGVTTLEWKYIRGSVEELYHLPTDPGELNEVQEKYPEMKEKLARAADAFAALTPEGGVACDMAGRQSELFGALGYLSLDAHVRHPSPDAPHPRDMVGVLDSLNDAFYYQNLGQMDKALSLFEECARLSPRTAVFHEYVGKARRKLGDHEGSIQAFREALALNPDLVDARLTLGIALQNVGDLEAAEKELREVVRRAPRMQQGYGYLANLLDQSGRFADELDVVDAMLKNVEFADPKEAQTFREYALSLRRKLEQR